jgi:hypothetical protein
MILPYFYHDFAIFSTLQGKQKKPRHVDYTFGGIEVMVGNLHGNLHGNSIVLEVSIVMGVPQK